MWRANSVPIPAGSTPHDALIQAWAQWRDPKTNKKGTFHLLISQPQALPCQSVARPSNETHKPNATRLGVPGVPCNRSVSSAEKCSHDTKNLNNSLPPSPPSSLLAPSTNYHSFDSIHNLLICPNQIHVGFRWMVGSLVRSSHCGHSIQLTC
jgi:hypothetical protein